MIDKYRSMQEIIMLLKSSVDIRQQSYIRDRYTLGVATRSLTFSNLDVSHRNSIRFYPFFFQSNWRPYCSYITIYYFDRDGDTCVKIYH
jgi:hypothetical protein